MQEQPGQQYMNLEVKVWIDAGFWDGQGKISGNIEGKSNFLNHEFAG
jgi:hypothetical protein